MKFYYDVIESYEIYIDFQDIYDHIKSEYPDYSNYAIYEHFIENVEYLLTEIYKCYDFVAYDNDRNVNDLVNRWGQWFDEKFGEGWDEV